MAVTVTHGFVSAKADSTDPTLVNPSNWNANHVITGLGKKSLTGTKDGDNQIFTVSDTLVTLQHMLFKNGLMLEETTDYTFLASGGSTTITFLIPPQSTDSLVVWS
jgi:hypothetical protein